MADVEIMVVGADMLAASNGKAHSLCNDNIGRDSGRIWS